MRWLVLAAILVGHGMQPAVAAVIDPGPFGPTQVKLNDGRVVQVPAETNAFFRMLTRRGRIHGQDSPYPSDSEIEAGLQLRRRHEPLWTARFGDVPRTPDNAYIFPVEGGDLSKHSGYHAKHRAEDIFAPVGRKVFAPAKMLIVHAGYLSKRAGEAVVGFIPAGGGQARARYVVLVHIDATAGKARMGDVVEAGTVVGTVANSDEAVVGNALGRPPHVHFQIREEQSDGWLQGIRVWDLLRAISRSAALKK
jgi:murein DD-endopeptidase MepM/ murein hydrolase activator NlpD